MLLAKSCTKPYNIKSGTLRLGSLHEYRETEIEQIADKEEGSLRYKLKFDGDVTIPTRIFNTLNGSAFKIGRDPVINFPGISNLSIGELNIVESGFENVTLRNSSAIIVREAPNCFVYCMSKVRKMSDSHNIFPDYDDSWYFRDFHADRFARSVGRILLNTIKAEHIKGNFVVPEQTDLGKLRMCFNHGEILYIDREIHITNKNISLLEDLIQKMGSMAFIKPPIPFAKEKEYRFQYTIVLDGYPVPPIKKSLILNSESLQKIIF